MATVTVYYSAPESAVLALRAALEAASLSEPGLAQVECGIKRGE